VFWLGSAIRTAWGRSSARRNAELRVFLLGDGVGCAVAGQQLPEGHYHLDRMLKPLVRRGEVACCGTASMRAPSAKSSWSRECDALMALAAPRRGERALDAGCGTGIYTTTGDARACASNPRGWGNSPAGGLSGTGGGTWIGLSPADAAAAGESGHRRTLYSSAPGRAPISFRRSQPAFQPRWRDMSKRTAIKRSEAIEAARLLNSQGYDFKQVVRHLVHVLGLESESAHAVAAQVCPPRPRRRRGQITVRFPNVRSR
jgi:hypothetical protein